MIVKPIVTQLIFKDDDNLIVENGRMYGLANNYFAEKHLGLAFEKYRDSDKYNIWVDVKVENSEIMLVTVKYDKGIDEYLDKAGNFMYMMSSYEFKCLEFEKCIEFMHLFN
jgi:hypothetical protein